MNEFDRLKNGNLFKLGLTTSGLFDCFVRFFDLRAEANLLKIAGSGFEEALGSDSTHSYVSGKFRIGLRMC